MRRRLDPFVQTTLMFFGKALLMQCYFQSEHDVGTIAPISKCSPRLSFHPICLLNLKYQVQETVLVSSRSQFTFTFANVYGRPIETVTQSIWKRRRCFSNASLKHEPCYVNVAAILNTALFEFASKLLLQQQSKQIKPSDISIRLLSKQTSIFIQHSCLCERYSA